MSTEWQLSFPSGNWVATHRGIRLVITRDNTGNPSDLTWFIGGQEVESIRLSCDLEWAKKLAVDVVDDRIPVDEKWKKAEQRDQQTDFVDG